MDNIQELRNKNMKLRSLLERSLLPIDRLIKIKEDIGHKFSIKETIKLFDDISSELGNSKTKERSKNLLAGVRITVPMRARDTEELQKITEKYLNEKKSKLT